jgi:hypothetical protein
MTDVPVWYWVDRAIVGIVPRRSADPAADVAPAGALATMQDADVWLQDLINALDELDRKSIRALRTGDAGRLAELEQQAERLREHIRFIAAYLQQP